jgi:hypothetical protein
MEALSPRSEVGEHGEKGDVTACAAGAQQWRLVAAYAV